MGACPKGSGRPAAGPSRARAAGSIEAVDARDRRRAAEVLRSLVELLSELGAYAWRANDLEYELWARVVGDADGPYGSRRIDVRPYLPALRALSEAAGGWWAWVAHIEGKVSHEDVRLVPLPEWERRYAGWRVSRLGR